MKTIKLIVDPDPFNHFNGNDLLVKRKKNHRFILITRFISKYNKVKVILNDKTIIFFENGLRHKLDGPALYHAGLEYWMYKGKILGSGPSYTQEKFEQNLKYLVFR